jgi:hypothetical protein
VSSSSGFMAHLLWRGQNSTSRGIVRRSEPAVAYPRPHFIRHRKSYPWVSLKPAAEVISIDLQRDAIVPATIEESANVQLGEAGDAQLPVLLDMNQFVEEQPVGERLVRDHHIAECDRRHVGEAGQVGESHPAQRHIEGRILHAQCSSHSPNRFSSAMVDSVLSWVDSL